MNILVIGSVVLIAALLIVGEVVWIFRSREFSALVRQIDDLNRKLAESDVRLQAQHEKMASAEMGLAAANIRLEGLTRLEQELQEERKATSELKGEISRLKAQAEAQESQMSSLAAMRAEIAQKFGTVADDVRAALTASMENSRREGQEKWAGITGISRDLHSQLRGVGDQVNRLGSHLERLVQEFNEVTGSLEGAIMSQAQRLHEFTAQETCELLPNLKPVDTVVRFPRHERDSVARETLADDPPPDEAPHAVAAD